MLLSPDLIMGTLAAMLAIVASSSPLSTLATFAQAAALAI
jgi:hypothetical protein